MGPGPLLCLHRWRWSSVCVHFHIHVIREPDQPDPLQSLVLYEPGSYLWLSNWPDPPYSLAGGVSMPSSPLFPGWEQLVISPLGYLSDLSISLHLMNHHPDLASATSSWMMPSCPMAPAPSTCLPLGRSPVKISWGVCWRAVLLVPPWGSVAADLRQMCHHSGTRVTSSGLYSLHNLHYPALCIYPAPSRE